MKKILSAALLVAGAVTPIGARVRVCVPKYFALPFVVVFERSTGEVKLSKNVISDVKLNAVRERGETSDCFDIKRLSEQVAYPLRVEKVTIRFPDLRSTMSFNDLYFAGYYRNNEFASDEIIRDITINPDKRS